MGKLDGVRIVRSPIHGYGGVATRAWTAGERVAEVDGVVWRAGDDVVDSHSLEIAPGLYYDMVDQTRYFNHACDPNLRLEKGAEGAEVWARFVARRDIAIGDELTYDYAFPDELAEPCRCGGPGCRGRIVEREAP